VIDRVAIAAAVRTPVGKRGGALAHEHPAELLGSTIASAIERSGIPPAAVEQVLAGCVSQVGDQAYNVGRIAWLTAGLPPETAGTTLDAQCGSSHQAVSLATTLIRAGAADVVIAGGVELMSRHPLGSNVAGGDGDPMGEKYRSLFEVTSQGEAAERIADHWHIDRSECDEIAVRSQSRAAAAWDAGRFDDEVLPMPALSRDQGIRESTLETLGALQPIFRPDGRHTPGNSSQISDGAAALVLASRRACERFSIEPLAYVGAVTAVGVDPVMKLTGPIPATQKIFDATETSAASYSIFEVNEAFASVIGAWQREIGAPTERVNVNGGAIALGHPVGATGARLCTTAVHELRRRGGGRALVAMCCGGGLGTATVIEA
jgi:acetyl-CoA acetyltransferase family protein